MGDYSKVLAKQEQFRDYLTGEVYQNPNQFGNPYRVVDKKRANVCLFYPLSHRIFLHL